MPSRPNLTFSSRETAVGRCALSLSCCANIRWLCVEPFCYLFTGIIEIHIFTPFQILNLCQALRDNKSPLQLVQMPLITVEKNKQEPTATDRVRHHMDNFTQSFQKRAPFFSCCWYLVFTLNNYQSICSLFSCMSLAHSVNTFLKTK